MRKSICIVLAGLAVAFTAHGQDAAPDEGENGSGVVEEVTVVGVRKALESALVNKRDADMIIDGIAADDIGNFPDLNLAESLQRVTGVQMDYSGDEGERRKGQIAIRGLPVSYSLTTYNGQILASPRPDFGFQFGNVESSIVSAVNVIKTPTARMDEGGLAGTVDIQTKRALDLTEDYMQLGVKTVHETLTDDFSPGYSMAFGKRFSDRWAMIGSISAQEQHFRGDAVRVNSYSRRDTNGDGVADIYTPAEIRLLSRDTTGDRVSGTLGVEFQATDNLRFGLNGLYVDDPIYHDWAQLRMRRAASTEVLASITDSTFGETVTRLNFVNPEMQLEQRLISEDNETRAITGDFEWETNDWAVRGVVHHTKASQFAYGRMGRRRVNRSNGNDLTVFVDTGAGNINDFYFQEVNGRLGDVNTYSNNGCTPAEIAAGRTESRCVNTSAGAGDWYTTYTSGHEYDVRDEETAYQLDVVRFFEDSFITTLEAGVKLRQSDQFFIRPEWELPNSQFDYSQIPNLGSMVSFADFTSGNGSGFFGGRLGGQVDNFYFQGSDAIYQALVGGQTFPAPTLGGLPYPADGGDIAGTYSDSSRDILAFYGMVTFDLSESVGVPIRGNAGLRYVDTQRDVEAFRDTNGALDLITASTSFDDVLPSLNLIWDISDNLLLRASYSETFVRPHAWNYQVSQSIDVTESAPGVTESIDIQLGNPDLLPFSADSVDLSLEWYSDSGTSLSLAYFQKKVANGFDDRVLCPSSLSDIPSLADSSINTLITEPLALNSSNICTDTNGVEVLITDQINNSDTFTIDGYEISVLQTFDFLDVPVLRNMGVQANYTHIDTSEGPDKDASGNRLPLAGVSDNTYNVIAFYEVEQFGVRLAYTGRSDYYDQTVFTVSGDNRFIATQDRLDMQVSYHPKWMDNLFFTLEIFNLTDEQFYAYQGTQDRFREAREVGQTWSLQVLYKFGL
jgi:TonB-dependent receptor